LEFQISIQLTGKERIGYSSGQKFDYVNFGPGIWLSIRLISPDNYPAIGTVVGASVRERLPTVSSMQMQREDKGGIDFTSMPEGITLQADRRIKSMSLRYADANIDLNAEWKRIKGMVDSGIIPSSRRMWRYVSSSSLNGSLLRDKKQIFFCVMNILELEEERNIHTDESMRDLLVFLEL